MSLLIVLAALAFLMFVAYRGYSVILFAPVAALGAVLLTDPVAGRAGVLQRLHGEDGRLREDSTSRCSCSAPCSARSSSCRDSPSRSSRRSSACSAASGRCCRSCVVCALLTYGGVSLFVVVFAVYPFAAEMFRQSDIPKRLIPGTIALGAFTFTMDSLPGTPQIQNIIPTTFFKTTTWAAPWLGLIGAVFILVVGLAYSEMAAPRRAGARRRLRHRSSQRAGAVRSGATAESAGRAPAAGRGRRRELRASPYADPARLRRDASKSTLGAASARSRRTIASVAAIWAVEGALLLGS